MTLQARAIHIICSHTKLREFENSVRPVVLKFMVLFIGLFHSLMQLNLQKLLPSHQAWRQLSLACVNVVSLLLKLPERNLWVTSGSGNRSQMKIGKTFVTDLDWSSLVSSHLVLHSSIGVLSPTLLEVQLRRLPTLLQVTRPFRGTFSPPQENAFNF